MFQVICYKQFQATHSLLFIFTIAQHFHFSVSRSLVGNNLTNTTTTNKIQKPCELPQPSRGAGNNDNLLTTTWPNGIVYYEIDKQSYKEGGIKIIKAGMKMIESQTRLDGMDCIKFIERKNESNWIKIFSDKGMGCWSIVGRFRNPVVQRLSIEVPQCLSEDTVAHELIHALGFHHEHTRPDRDEWIEVLYDNIDPSARFEYDIKDSFFKNLNTPYDYNSIMHYSPYDFSIDSRKPTMRPLKKSSIINPGKKLSSIDVKEIRTMYKCIKDNSKDKPEIRESPIDEDTDTGSVTESVKNKIKLIGKDKSKDKPKIRESSKDEDTDPVKSKIKWIGEDIYIVNEANSEDWTVYNSTNHEEIYKFKFVENLGKNNFILRDESLDIYLKLTEKNILLSQHKTKNYTLYQWGSWEKKFVKFLKWASKDCYIENKVNTTEWYVYKVKDDEEVQVLKFVRYDGKDLILKNDDLEDSVKYYKLTDKNILWSDQPDGKFVLFKKGKWDKRSKINN